MRSEDVQKLRINTGVTTARPRNISRIDADSSAHEVQTATPAVKTDATASLHERWEAMRTSELKLGAGRGFFGGEPPTKKILSYSPQRMWTFCAFITARPLTAFYGNLRFHIFWSFIFPIGFCILLFAADGGAPIVGGEAGPGRKFAILCEGLFKEQSDGFRGLVGYVLGGYVARAFTMWYVRRKNYAAFCGACRNLTLNLAAALPMDHTSAPGTISAAELHAVRRNLGRWTVLAHELGTLKGRGAIDSAQAEEYLTQIGMLHEGEWAAMVHGDRHTTVLWWVQLAAQRLCKRGVIEAAGLRSVQEGVTGYRAQANDLMSSLDRDIPYPYASLLGMIVKTNVILMTLWRTFELYLNLCGTMTGAQNWMASGNPECVMVGNPTFPNQNALYFMTMIIVQLVTLFLWNMSYKAMYDLGKVLHNPFGNRVIDVAHETIHAGLRQLAEELLGEAVHHLPPEMPQDESNE